MFAILGLPSFSSKKNVGVVVEIHALLAIRRKFLALSVLVLVEEVFLVVDVCGRCHFRLFYLPGFSTEAARVNPYV